MLAPAKINLWLNVVGRRDDGYHLLDSLVAFVDLADQIVNRDLFGPGGFVFPNAWFQTVNSLAIITLAPGEMPRSSGSAFAIGSVATVTVVACGDPTAVVDAASATRTPTNAPRAAPRRREKPPGT